MHCKHALIGASFLVRGQRGTHPVRLIEEKVLWWWKTYPTEWSVPAHGASETGDGNLPVPNPTKMASCSAVRRHRLCPVSYCKLTMEENNLAAAVSIEEGVPIWMQWLCGLGFEHQGNRGEGFLITSMVDQYRDDPSHWQSTINQPATAAQKKPN